eukprot:jgi/Mesen1/8289/ME000045S07736
MVVIEEVEEVEEHVAPWLEPVNAPESVERNSPKNAKTSSSGFKFSFPQAKVKEKASPIRQGETHVKESRESTSNLSTQSTSDSYSNIAVEGDVSGHSTSNGGTEHLRGVEAMQEDVEKVGHSDGFYAKSVENLSNLHVGEEFQAETGKERASSSDEATAADVASSSQDNPSELPGREPSEGISVRASSTGEHLDSSELEDDKGDTGSRAEADGYETASEGEDETAAEQVHEVVESSSEDVFQDALSEEDLRKKALSQAEAAKAEGNALYVKKDFDGALEAYRRALDLVPDHEDAKDNRAAYYSNSAICHINLENWEEAVVASTKALELNPSYLKALQRRAQANEKLDKHEDALADLKKVVELDPGNKPAQIAVRRLEPIVAEKREKMKEEMLGKLKELGNSVLGHFGLSVDNFQAVKDPATGSYSINFQK